MEHDAKHIPIKTRILEKIRRKEVTMHSHGYFTFKFITLVFVAILALVVSVLILNFLLFNLRISGHESLLHGGLRGWDLFLRVFPWPLLAIDIVLIMIAEWLVRQFRFGYRSPVLYLLGGLLAATIALGLALDRGTPLNDALLNRADHDALPFPLGELYEQTRNPEHREGLCRCTIVGFEGNTIIADDADRATTHVVVILPPDNSIATSSLRIGEDVLIAGDREGGTIHAFYIGEIYLRDEQE